MSGVLGSPHHHLRLTGSTNARARRLARAGAPHGTLVTADEQSAGRGRQGRRWETPAGSALLMSLVLRDPPPLLTLAAGTAVAAVAERFDAAGRDAAVKWPNDVLLEGGKVAGILVEGRPQEGWAVLGIGLNVAVSLDRLAPEVRGRAATLGRSADQLPQVLTAMLDELARAVQQGEEVTLARLRERDALRDRPVAWAGGEGAAAGIDEHGRLCVRTAEGTVALEAGEVHLADPGTGPAAEPRTR